MERVLAQQRTFSYSFRTYARLTPLAVTPKLDLGNPAARRDSGEKLERLQKVADAL